MIRFHNKLKFPHSDDFSDLYDGNWRNDPNNKSVAEILGEFPHGSRQSNLP